MYLADRAVFGEANASTLIVFAFVTFFFRRTNLQLKQIITPFVLLRVSLATTIASYKFFGPSALIAVAARICTC
jgi:hypothetical protein